MVSRENKFKLAAFILLFISICFNFKVWIIDYYFLGIFHSKKEIVIQPTLITTMISIFFFGGYIIRNVNDIFNDIVKIIFCALDILFFWIYSYVFKWKNKLFRFQFSISFASNSYINVDRIEIPFKIYNFSFYSLFCSFHWAT